MIVTLLRHGKAGEAATDRQRELTPRGERDVARVADVLRKGCKKHSTALPDLACYSKWRRTDQTCARVCEDLGIRGEARDALIPGQDAPAVEELIEELMSRSRAPQHVLLVSHNPLVSTLLTHFADREDRVGPLNPGGLATIRLRAAAADCGDLLFWAMPPEYAIQV